MFLSAMAGYGFAKFDFHGKKLMFTLVLATMMIPLQVTMIPTYLILNNAQLTNTLAGIALPTLVVGFNLFLFRQFMLAVPDELLEAARLDGATEWQTFRKIVLPIFAADPGCPGRAHLHRRMEQLLLAVDHRQRPGPLHACRSDCPCCASNRPSIPHCRWPERR